MIMTMAFLLVAGSLTALSWKWELDKKIAFSWSILMGFLAALTLALLRNAGYSLSSFLQLLIAWLEAAVFSLIVVLFLFFRNPQRKPPAMERILVSPADGIVKYIKEIHDNEFPFALKNRNAIPLAEFTGTDILANVGIQIGIGMSLLDVHVNRSPVAGDVSLLRRVPGSFGSLKKISSLLENERVVAAISSGSMKIGLVLIASRLVRRIRMYIVEGQNVEIGQRIGMIRFGSQVDVFIPLSTTLKISTKPGDKVRAGETILAEF